MLNAYLELQEQQNTNAENMDNKKNGIAIKIEQVSKHIKDKNKGEEDDLNSSYCSNNSSSKNSDFDTDLE